MPHIAQKKDQQFDTSRPSDAKPIAAAIAFEKELTELSRKHGIGITGSMTLFIMEPDDFERRYSSNEQSQLQFA